MRRMKTCLGSLLLPVILALVGTAVYHASVNGELRFELRDSNEEYINTRRSYRPAPVKQNVPKPTAVPAPSLEDDAVAEEADT